jgi:DNA repair and recombination protein RAD54B
MSSILGTYATFKAVYEDPIAKSRSTTASEEDRNLGESRLAELARLTNLFVLRRTSEILEQFLPPKHDIVLMCQPSPLQIMAYNKLEESRAFKNWMQEASNFLVIITALRKICNSPRLITAKCEEARGISELGDEGFSLYNEMHDLIQLDKGRDVGGKLDVLRQLLVHIIDHTADKVVVVSNYVETLDLIESSCSDIHSQMYRIDGSTAQPKRTELIQKVNSSSDTTRIVLLSSKAGGQGINLVGACRLILFDIDWNPANDNQAMARVWRDGQRHPVFIYRLILTGTIEEVVFQRQFLKKDLSNAILDDAQKGSLTFSAGDLKELSKLRRDTLCHTHDLMGCQCHVGFSFSFRSTAPHPSV